MSENPPLSVLFPPATLADWRADVEAALGGRSFEKLGSRTRDGIRIEPLYTGNGSAADPSGLAGLKPFTRGARALGRALERLDLRTFHAHPDARVVAEFLAVDAGAGARSTLLRVDLSGDRGRIDDDSGVLVAGPEDLRTALASVDLSGFAVHLEPGGAFVAAAEALLEAWEHAGVEPASIRGGFGADPFGSLAREGGSAEILAESIRDAVRLAATNHVARPGVLALAVDGAPWDEAGATTAQQLGIVLAGGVELLRAANEHELDPGVVARQLELRLRLGTEFFESVAALRALRWTWTRVTEACGLETDAARRPVHAQVSRRVLTRRDPWVNVLRGTAAGFAGIVGGADAVGCEPFDSRLGVPSELGRRLARNTILLLNEEAHLSRIVDPAGGSWFLESLTTELAEVAWGFLQQIEGEGGLARVLTGGWLRDRIDEAWAAQHHELSTRRRPVTGVSEFPAPDSHRPKTAAPDLDRLRGGVRARPTDPPTGGVRGSASDDGLRPWPFRPLAGPFESLRDASEEHRERTGRAPLVFLANLGRVSEHVARSTWTRSFFEAGGFQVESGDGFSDGAVAASAFSASDAEIAVICSSDTVYEQQAAATARALREAGARTILLAGRPGSREEEWTDAGVDRFVYVGCDVRGTLFELLVEEGVEP